MATFRKRGTRWQAQIFLRGVRASKTFLTKLEAQQWASQTETDILNGNDCTIFPGAGKTFGDLLKRYADEVSSTKRGEDWELQRIAHTLRQPIADIELQNFDQRDIAAWRDRRLRTVSDSTVRREWALLSHACGVAVKEWKWLKENPMREVRKPPQTESRDRIASDDEIARLLYALGYQPDETPKTISAKIGACMIFAIETAMRAGEIAGLTWDRVFLDKRYCKTFGKTPAARRDVALSAEAIRVINQLPRDHETVFNLSTSQIDSLFRKAKKNALVTDLHFHDMRHTAITRLAKKLDVLPLARMIGHRDLKMLLIYYNETAENIAGRL